MCNVLFLRTVCVHCVLAAHATCRGCLQVSGCYTIRLMPDPWQREQIQREVGIRHVLHYQWVWLNVVKPLNRQNPPWEHSMASMHVSKLHQFDGSKSCSLKQVCSALCLWAVIGAM